MYMWVRLRRAHGGVGGGACGGDGGGEHVETSGFPSIPIGRNSPVVPVGSPPTSSRWYVYTKLPSILSFSFVGIDALPPLMSEAISVTATVW